MGREREREKSAKEGKSEGEREGGREGEMRESMERFWQGIVVRGEKKKTCRGCRSDGMWAAA
jgi:hypothetical protein